MLKYTHNGISVRRVNGESDTCIFSNRKKRMSPVATVIHVNPSRNLMQPKPVRNYFLLLPKRQHFLCCKSGEGGFHWLL